MYWDIGNLILQQQQTEGWSARVIPKLATDLKNELPESKGFSERSLGYMLRLAKEYPILQQAAAKLATQQVFSIPWGHQMLLMDKIKEIETRFWYMQQTLQNGWSRESLASMSH